MQKIKNEIDLSLRLAIIICLNVFLVISGTLILLNKHRNRNIRGYILCKNINDNNQKNDSIDTVEVSDNSVIICNIHIGTKGNLRIKTQKEENGEYINLSFGKNSNIKLAVTDISNKDKVSMISGYIINQNTIAENVIELIIKDKPTPVNIIQ